VVVAVAAAVEVLWARVGVYLTWLRLTGNCLSGRKLVGLVVKDLRGLVAGESDAEAAARSDGRCTR